MRGSDQKPSAGAVSLPPGVVRSQLVRVLESTHFADAPRLKRFLSFIVEETLLDRSNRLKGYAIGLEVFDRPEDFDPQTDTIVRVQAGQLRRRLDLYYADQGRDDPLRIYVPKGTYGPLFQVMFDPETSADKPQAAKQLPSEKGPSIAILPFQNYGGNPDDQYFADGLTEEIIANLCRFRDLFVYSRTTTNRLVRDGADLRQIHDELGVDFVVEGSVRKSKESVRATVQLIDAATDGHLFSEQYERPLSPEGVFEIQDEIALRIASRIADRYGPLGTYAARARRNGQSGRWETYDWITRFYGYYASHDPMQHLDVRHGLADALEKDPGSSDCWAALSTVLLDEHRFHFNARQGFPALDNAFDYAQKSVSLDLENAFAYLALAMAHFHRREFVQFRVAAERAIELNPGHADALADIGTGYCLLGEWERGLPLTARAIELSPVHPGWYHLARSCHYFLDGDISAAVVELKEAPMPGFYWHHALLASFYGEAGDAERASREVANLLESYPDFAAGARREIDIVCMYDALADALMAGWRKAGLAII